MFGSRDSSVALFEIQMKSEGGGIYSQASVVFICGKSVPFFLRVCVRFLL